MPNASEQSDSAAGSALLSLLGVDLQGVTAQLGLGCSPISAVGLGGGKACASNAVCCQNNNVVSVAFFDFHVEGESGT